MHTGEDYVLRALRSGASGYVLKGSAPRELELALASVARGDVFLSPAISRHVIEVYLNGTGNQTSSLEQLTHRQREFCSSLPKAGRTRKWRGCSVPA